MKSRIFQISIKSINFKILSLYLKFLKKVLINLGVDFTLVELPVKRKRKTLLKAPHVNKTAREQFEIKYSKVCLSIYSKISTLVLKWVLVNKPAILDIKIKYM